MVKTDPSIETITELQEKYDKVTSEAKTLNAREGLERLGLVWKNINTLSIETAYRWIDPIGFIAEVEEVQSRQAGRLHQWRNILAILPIITSWLSLTYAVYSYQQYVVANPKAIEQPFIKLWQEGFGGRDPYTLSITALVAAIILIIYVVLLATSQKIEAQAQMKADRFSKMLQSFMGALDENMRNVPALLPRDADLPQVTRAIQNSINLAIQTSEQVITDAQADLEGLLHTYRENAETLNAQTVNVVSTLHKLVDDLRPYMSTFADQVNQMTPTFQNLTQSTAQMTQSLTENAERYTQIGTELDAKISILTGSHGQLINQLGGVAGQLSTIADTIQIDTNAITGAQVALERLLNTYRESIEALNIQTTGLVGNVQQQLNDFRGEMGKLTQEMSQLTPISQNLTQSTAQMTQSLAENADRYTQIGTQLDTKISTLTDSQENLFHQLGKVAGQLSSIAMEAASVGQAAHETSIEMRGAVDSVLTATRTFNDLVVELREGTTQAISQMTREITSAASSVKEVTSQLGKRTKSLQAAIKAAENAVSIQSFKGEEQAEPDYPEHEQAISNKETGAPEHKSKTVENLKVVKDEIREKPLKRWVFPFGLFRRKEQTKPTIAELEQKAQIQEGELPPIEPGR